MKLSLAFALILCSAALLLTACAKPVPTPPAPESTAAVTTGTSAPPAPKEITEELENPLFSGADPWVTKDGTYYYYCYSTGRGVAVARAKDLLKLKQNGKTVFTAPDTGAYSQNYWAPELHLLDGNWYIYVACDDGANEHHRMFVLKGTDPSDPTKPFKMAGQLKESSGEWAIDGTVFEWKNELYTVWSGWKDGRGDVQHLFIAHMSDPTHIDSERVLLSSPTLPWECVGMMINEGPAALIAGDTLRVVYSASGSWTDDYCLGMLTLTGDDPLSPAAWTKSDEPVFKKNLTVFGVGHCSFVEYHGLTVMAYHGMTQSGSGWEGRRIFLKPVSFKKGAPVFGSPALTALFSWEETQESDP